MGGCLKGRLEVIPDRQTENRSVTTVSSIRQSVSPKSQVWATQLLGLAKGGLGPGGLGRHCAGGHDEGGDGQKDREGDAVCAAHSNSPFPERH